MSYVFKNARALEELCKEHNVPISEIALRYEQETSDISKEEIYARLEIILNAMEKAVHTAVENPMESKSGLVQGDAHRFFGEWTKRKNDMILNETALRAMTWSMATNESNACSQCIVACPTAGSAGIVPSALFAIRYRFDLPREALLRGLLNTSAIGLIIEENAMMSGAEGGCQSEDGSAAAMAASAITELRGGTVEECLNAAALSLKNTLGLVCDPIGGLVEVPCVKRTAFMVLNSFTSSDLVSCGVRSIVPFDEVVDAMRRIGEAMPTSLRETAQGGLATTKTGIEAAKRMEEL